MRVIRFTRLSSGEPFSGRRSTRTVRDEFGMQGVNGDKGFNANAINNREIHGILDSEHDCDIRHGTVLLGCVTGLWGFCDLLASSVLLAQESPWELQTHVGR